MSFYELAAQVIPILMLAIVVQLRSLRYYDEGERDLNVSVSLVALATLGVLVAGEWFALDALWDETGDARHGAWVKMALYVGGGVAAYPTAAHQLRAIARDFKAAREEERLGTWFLVWVLLVGGCLAGLIWSSYGFLASD